ncbi:MAG: hypothetical protein WA705_03275 [Candidatus Ozemobacteraceae bacterium]
MIDDITHGDFYVSIPLVLFDFSSGETTTVSVVILICTVILAIICSILLWDFLRTKRAEMATRLKNSQRIQEPQNSIIDLMNSPEGKPFIDLFHSFFITNIKPVAIYERQPRNDGTTAFVLNQEKRCSTADQALVKHGKTMEDIQAVVDRITARMMDIPSGDLVRQIIISGLDFEHIEMRKIANMLVITLPILKKEMLLMEYALWHECFCHTGPMRIVAIEETLAYALTFMHMVNVLRDAQSDPAALLRCNQAFEEISTSQIEEKMTSRGTYSSTKANRDLQAVVNEKEKQTGKKLESEETLRIAIPLAVRVMRENLDIFKQDFHTELYEKNTDDQIINLLIEVWEREKENFLRGKPLYGIILPLALMVSGVF